MQAYEVNIARMRDDEAALAAADIPAVSPVSTTPGASGSGQTPGAFQVLVLFGQWLLVLQPIGTRSQQ